MTLEEVTALENEWIAKYPHNPVADINAVCEQMGIYDAWRNIYKLYIIEARKGDIEALKRALFIYWYSCSEPNKYSGIPPLHDDLTKEVLGMVNDIVKKDELDTELKWMLPWYYFIADFYIDRFDGFAQLKKVSRKGNPKLFKRLHKESSFDNRGQLGQYWDSIIKAKDVGLIWRLIFKFREFKERHLI